MHETEGRRYPVTVLEHFVPNSLVINGRDRLAPCRYVGLWGRNRGLKAISRERRKVVHLKSSPFSQVEVKKKKNSSLEVRCFLEAQIGSLLQVEHSCLFSDRKLCDVGLSDHCGEGTADIGTLAAWLALGCL